MKDKLVTLVKSIVEQEDKVEVEESSEGGVVNLTIKVDPEEIGKVIGKGGKVIKSLRNVMKIAAMKQNIKVFVNLAENPQ
ncbi:MAG: hypothetical protein A2798_02790 [Candidatus Levybacteria bacterium RIFCSPHIGHO2_01_FULL_37_17]|nr:MAG: hypothetical protein A2798_02790 [Candidatus Levybacteria bacterium RIFCSPHIGHO2_01_FULL_37_17]OGH36783.1 MAG: hypothetical protein A2959_00780 [Candidatus Levybacteria bacterium RIFCSPLOWO2_01_FULL_38_23]